MIWDGFNKRKFPRLNLRCELILQDKPAGHVIRTKTENVGAGGVCVILEELLERFSVLSVRLELDPDLPWMECLGKVVWMVPSRDLTSKRERFDTGIEFLGLEPAQQDLIRYYVESRMDAADKIRS